MSFHNATDHSQILCDIKKYIKLDYDTIHVVSTWFISNICNNPENFAEPQKRSSSHNWHFCVRGHRECQIEYIYLTS